MLKRIFGVASDKSSHLILVFTWLCANRFCLIQNELKLFNIIIYTRKKQLSGLFIVLRK